ncbi:unnamed protein product [marine sediment metagenome]|uniref:Uncharacterized protein n=1 Tax=marine sediment metagenome TaxID=412755 RepID=X0VSG7_9ZZZZ
MTRPKLIEIRDAGTFIPALAIQLCPDRSEATYLLRRAGYVEQTAVLLFHLERGIGHADPFEWSYSRTMKVAHLALAGQSIHEAVEGRMREHSFDRVNWGDVIDVEYILGITDARKRSEQETAPV